MARIVVQCQYTGHYILTGVDTKSAVTIAGGRIRCPYCEADHIWTSGDSRPDERTPFRTPPRTLIRQAG